LEVDVSDHTHDADWHIRELLNHLDAGAKYDSNFADTPHRYVEWLREHFVSDTEVEAQMKEFAEATFPTEYRGLLTATGVRVHGICPHHLLPIFYSVDLGYLPHTKAIGVSKLARLANVVAKRPVIQEDVTAQLAKALCTMLETQNVAVIVRGLHLCMAVRGVRSSSIVTTATMVGKFLENDAGLKDEFYATISRDTDGRFDLV
jgi:GTP cyclohydrolase IA